MARLERFLKGITRSLAVLALCMWGLVWYRVGLVPEEGPGKQVSSSDRPNTKQDPPTPAASAVETLMSVDDVLAQVNRYTDEGFETFLSQRKQELAAASRSVEGVLAQANRYTDEELDAFLSQRKQELEAASIAVEDILAQGNRYTEQEIEAFFVDLRQRHQIELDKLPLPWTEETWNSINALVVDAYKNGHYEIGIGHAERAILIAHTVFGNDHADTATSLGNLAELYNKQGRYGEAEPLYVEALAIKRAALPEGHPSIATSLNNLAGHYYSLEHYAQAEPLLLEALRLRRTTLTEGHPDVAEVFNNLGSVYKGLRMYVDAESFYMKSLELEYNKAEGYAEESIAITLTNLAELYRVQQGRYRQAEPLLLESLVLMRTALPLVHPTMATLLNNLAMYYENQARYNQAEFLYKKALAILRAALPAGHPHIVLILENLSNLNATRGQRHKSSEYLNMAVASLTGRLYPNMKACAEVGEAEEVRLNLVSNRLVTLYAHLVIHTAEYAIIDGVPLSSLAVSSFFRINQELELSTTASALAEAQASIVGGEEATLRLSKEWCGLRKDLTKAKDDLGELASQGNPAFVGRIHQLKDEIASLETAFEAKDAELREIFPEYAELAIPKSVSEAQAKAMLRQGEALLTFIKVKYEDVQGYLALLVTPGLSVPIALPVDFEALAGQVNTLREGVTFPEVQDRVLSAGDLPDFDLGLANELYESVFAPLEPYLENVAHVIVVPSGPLESLPFQTLVTELPENMDDDRYANYRSATFLGDQYAFSVLPSVSSLKALRDPVRLKKRAALDPSSPFLGFGDPDLRGQTSGDFALSNASGVTNVGAVRDLTRLDQTGPMLTTLKNVLKGADENLYLKEAATEAQLYEVKDQLPDQEVVVFATHGLVANELPALNLTEPALVMTPPADESDVDPRNDGLLKASEIVGLSFNADLIVLSACNTAAADGTPGAEALSGLAKSFFYTGAQSLLVSHWPTDAITSAALITTMIRLQKEQGLGYAEAHKHGLQIIKAVSDYWPEDEEVSNALISLMYDLHTNQGLDYATAYDQALTQLDYQPSDTERAAYFSHPALWAPFTMVGEAGTPQDGGV